MPPFVGVISTDAILPSSPSPTSSSLAQLRRCQSADDALTASAAGGDGVATIQQSPNEEEQHKLAPVIRSLSAHATSAREPIANKNRSKSMEWVGSYFFDFDALKPRDDGSDLSEDDLLKMKEVLNESDDVTVEGYFSEADFLSDNWKGASEYIPPIGLAVVAGGLCLFNPIVFVGGALTACTALGAVHAAQNYHDACVDGHLCDWFGTSNIADSTIDGSEQAMRRNGVQTVKLEKDGNDEEPLLKEEVSGTYAMTSLADGDGVPILDTSLLNPSFLSDLPAEAPIPLDPSNFTTTEQAMKWMHQYYPRLGHQNVECFEFRGLNAREFRDVFLADDAPYTFCEFQKKRQDKDIVYGPWETVPDETTRQPISMAPSAKAVIRPAQGSMEKRTLKFRAKTNSGLFGPPYATTTKVQRCWIPSKWLLVLESKTTLKDIPFSDRFYVLERWVVSSLKTGEQPQQYVSSMHVSCQVVMMKSCAFESQIVSKSHETVTEIALQWNDMAQTALQRTEHARKLRLREQEQYDLGHEPIGHNGDPDHAAARTMSVDEQMDGSIEVERIGRSQLRILLGDDTTMDSSTLSVSSGKPPRRSRGSSIRRRLGRSVSSVMKRRRSTSDLKGLQ